MDYVNAEGQRAYRLYCLNGGGAADAQPRKAEQRKRGGSRDVCGGVDHKRLILKIPACMPAVKQGLHRKARGAQRSRARQAEQGLCIFVQLKPPQYASRYVKRAYPYKRISAVAVKNIRFKKCGRGAAEQKKGGKRQLHLRAAHRPNAAVEYRRKEKHYEIRREVPVFVRNHRHKAIGKALRREQFRIKAVFERGRDYAVKFNKQPQRGKAAVFRAHCIYAHKAAYKGVDVYGAHKKRFRAPRRKVLRRAGRNAFKHAALPKKMQPHYHNHSDYSEQVHAVVSFRLIHRKARRQAPQARAYRSA